MPEIRPFHATMYHRRLSSRAVLSPPYDVISPAERRALAARSPYNAVHLVLPPSPGRAKALLDRWRDERVLTDDRRPAYYWCRQSYRWRGQRWQGEGLLALLRLEEPGRGDVVPHEEINPRVGDQQQEQLRVTRANFSPVMMLYRDERLLLENRLAQLRTSRRPCRSYLDDQGVRFSLWRLRASAVVAEAFAGRRLFIADGHHRYTSAWRHSLVRGGGGADFLLCYFLNAAAGAPPVFAFHRYLPRVDARQFARLREHCGLEELPGLDALQAALRPGMIGVARGRHCYLLGTRAPAGREAPYLHREIMSGLFGCADDEASYEKDAAAALRRADREGGVVFFLPPLEAAALESLWGEGVVLPRKSTMFYPKIPSGLVIYRHRNGVAGVDATERRNKT